VRARTLEAYGKHYTVAWPGEEHASGRPVRRSPLWGTLKAQGACFGEKLGWERPNWFADLAAGEVAQDRYSFTRPGWTDAVAREHRAAREAAVLIDQTSFAKFLLEGPDATAALSWICAGDIEKAPGRLTYTQMLNARGGIEADLTVARLADDSYYIVTGTGFATHDHDWMRRNLPEDAQLRLADVTSSRAVLSLMGPRARDILAAVAEADVSNAALPFGSARTILVAGAEVLALRVTYVGELGWELHIPAEYALTVYEALMAAGRPLGLVNAGYRAIETLRLEKGYRAWGADIGPDHTPVEAGLAWALKLKSNKPFLGREAVARQVAEGVTKRLAGFTVDDPGAVLLGRETIYRDGVRAGWLSSGGFGHTVGKAIGYGYVRNAEGVTEGWLRAGHYELEIATERVPANLHLAPLHDPGNTCVKG